MRVRTATKKKVVAIINSNDLIYIIHFTPCGDLSFLFYLLQRNVRQKLKCRGAWKDGRSSDATEHLSCSWLCSLGQSPCMVLLISENAAVVFVSLCGLSVRSGLKLVCN